MQENRRLVCIGRSAGSSGWCYRLIELFVHIALSNRREFPVVISTSPPPGNTCHEPLWYTLNQTNAGKLIKE